MDGIKVRILKVDAFDPDKVNPLDPGSGKVKLHDHGAPGDVITLSSARAQKLIESGWAEAVPE